MAMKHFGKAGRCALWFSPIVIVPVAVFASIPWLKQQNDAVALGIAAAASIFVMGYSFFLTARVNSRLDEVEIAGQRFANTKGMTIGTVASCAGDAVSAVDERAGGSGEHHRRGVAGKGDQTGNHYRFHAGRHLAVTGYGGCRYLVGTAPWGPGMTPRRLSI